MVRLTNQNEEMEDSVKEIPTLKVQLQVRRGSVHTSATKASEIQVPLSHCNHIRVNPCCDSFIKNQDVM